MKSNTERDSGLKQANEERDRGAGAERVMAPNSAAIKFPQRPPRVIHVFSRS